MRLATDMAITKVEPTSLVMSIWIESDEAEYHFPLMMMRRGRYFVEMAIEYRKDGVEEWTHVLDGVVPKPILDRYAEVKPVAEQRLEERHLQDTQGLVTEMEKLLKRTVGNVSGDSPQTEIGKLVDEYEAILNETQKHLAALGKNASLMTPEMRERVRGLLRRLAVNDADYSGLEARVAASMSDEERKAMKRGGHGFLYGRDNWTGVESDWLKKTFMAGRPEATPTGRLNVEPPNHPWEGFGVVRFKPNWEFYDKPLGEPYDERKGPMTLVVLTDREKDLDRVKLRDLRARLNRAKQQKNKHLVADLEKQLKALLGGTK